MAIQIQYRRGTASEWSTANPTLALGEPGYETDTFRFKVGNGSTEWNSLGYSSGIQGEGYSDVVSTTSRTIGGAATYQFTTGLLLTGGGTGSFKVGDSVRVIDSSSASNYIEGTITALTKATVSVGGSITVTATRYSGSGTISSWVFSLVGVAGSGYSGVTSTTSTIAIGTPTAGVYTFSIPVLVGTGAYKVGDLVRVFNTSSPSNYIDGTITSLTAVSGSTPGSIVVTPIATGGSGTPSGWSFSLVGQPAFGYSGVTSTTSRVIGSAATYQFDIATTIGTGAYKVGDFVRVFSASNTANFIEGRITSLTAVSGATQGSITVTATDYGGSGTITDWSFSLAGQPAFGYSGVTSASTFTIGSASTYAFSVTAAVGTGAYQNGQRVRVYATADATKYIEGTITSFTAVSGGTAATITVTAETYGGSGSVSAWTFSLAGGSGTTGITSSTSITIPTTTFTSGTTYTFTVNTLGALAVGTRVRAYATTDTSKYIEGPISAVSTTTPSITIAADTFGGIGGAQTSWAIVVAGGNGYTNVTGTATIAIATSSVGSPTAVTVGNIGAYQVNQRVRVFQTSTPTNYIEGIITAVAGSSTLLPQISVSVDATSGSGNLTAYTMCLAGNITTTAVEFVIDGGGDVITTGLKGYLEIPFSGTITQWTAMTETASGTITIDVLRSTYSGFPTQTSLVGAGTKPAISTGQKNTAAPASWTSTVITAGDILGFNVDAVSLCTRVTISLKMTRAS